MTVQKIRVIKSKYSCIDEYAFVSHTVVCWRCSNYRVFFMAHSLWLVLQVVKVFFFFFAGIVFGSAGNG
jgi:hypothetical protein